MYPIVGTEALASGQLSRRELARHVAVYRNVYVPQGFKVKAEHRAVAAWLWSGRSATVAGLSAAALLGSDFIDAHLPAELNRPNGKPVSGILIHRDELADDEICRVGGIPCTTPARTGYDLARRRGLTRAVIRLDQLALATEVQPADIERLAQRHPGTRGLVQLRRAIDLMDGGAESPQETWTRLKLIDAGLPRPQTQIVVRDEFRRFVARVDMGWESAKVAVEYDGVQHWEDPAQYEKDIDRLAELERLGWRIIRVSADMLRLRSAVIVERVVRALVAAGFHFPEWPLTPRSGALRVA